MAALYFVLAHFLTFRAGNLHISFASLPILLLSGFYGAPEGALSALLGELLNQMLLYGFTPTTPLWLLPPAFRALMLSLGFWVLRKRNPGKEPWQKPLPYGAVVLISSVLTTLMNTLVIWLDSLIGHYFSIPYVFGDLALRLAAGILTAVVLSAVSIPIFSALQAVQKRGRL